MGWLTSVIRGILEALLPFLFTKEATHAEDSEQAPINLRHAWIGRINSRLRKLKSKSSSDPADSDDS